MRHQQRATRDPREKQMRGSGVLKKSPALPVLAAVSLAGLALLKHDAHAGSQESMSMYPQYKALSNNPDYNLRACAVTLHHNDGSIRTASGVAIAPTLVLHSGHFTPSGATASKITHVTFGPNYKTGERLIIEAESSERHPDYIYGDASTTDAGLVHLKEPIPNFKPVEFAQYQAGSVATMVDYGNIGDPTTGEQPSLGDRLAGNALAADTYSSLAGSDYAWAPYRPDKYFVFKYNAPNVLQPTQGLQYSSGSAWFQNGKLVSISIAAPSGTNRCTVGLKVMLPAVQSWLQPKIQASWDSLPPDYFKSPELNLALNDQENPAGVGTQNRGEPSSVTVFWDKKASGLTLEKSEDLINWSKIDVYNNGPNGNLVLYGAGSHTENASNLPQHYFRLREPE